jgi:hypothetical protein
MLQTSALNGLLLGGLLMAQCKFLSGRWAAFILRVRLLLLLEFEIFNDLVEIASWRFGGRRRYGVGMWWFDRSESGLTAKFEL